VSQAVTCRKRAVGAAWLDSVAKLGKLQESSPKVPGNVVAAMVAVRRHAGVELLEARCWLGAQ
jgi:hypothetical protein